MDEAAELVEQKKEEFLDKKDEFIEIYTDHCTYFTNSFNDLEL